MDNRHENYHVLNLIGYGLAKFDMEFINKLGFQTKQAFFAHVVKLGVADTLGVVKNRQDLFDPFFDNQRKGWWQKGDAYIHRKIFIDSVFGDLDARNYADIVALRLDEFAEPSARKSPMVAPIIKSRFKQLQHTGLEAESFFMHNYSEVDSFKGGVLQDARLMGDGYDFQIEVAGRFFLVEVKGVRGESGNVRLTEMEFKTAENFKADFALTVVSNLDDQPRIKTVFDPLASISFSQRKTEITQLSYHSKVTRW